MARRSPPSPYFSLLACGSDSSTQTTTQPASPFGSSGQQANPTNMAPENPAPPATPTGNGSEQNPPTSPANTPANERWAGFRAAISYTFDAAVADSALRGAECPGRADDVHGGQSL